MICTVFNSKYGCLVQYIYFGEKIQIIWLQIILTQEPEEKNFPFHYGRTTTIGHHIRNSQSQKLIFQGKF